MNKEEFVINRSRDLLKELSPDQEAKWGRMTAQHMVEHLGILFMIAGGRITPQGLPSEKQQKYYQLLKSGSFSFKPNTKSPALPEDPLPLRFQSLEEARQAAIKGLDAFQQYFNDAPDAKVEHPVFGPLTYQDWLDFHYIHLKHHFKQFGLIEDN